MPQPQWPPGIPAAFAVVTASSAGSHENRSPAAAAGGALSVCVLNEQMPCQVRRIGVAKT